MSATYRCEPRYHKTSTMELLLQTRKELNEVREQINELVKKRDALESAETLVEREVAEWMFRDSHDTDVLLRSSLTAPSHVVVVVVFRVNEHGRVTVSAITPTK